ncbi:MAG: MarR family winged helix-turn-helix transcriptional regulator [Peptococcaceae bacterium]
MEVHQENRARLDQFNRLFRESNKLYHDLAIKLSLSDSAITILYTLCQLGDGCLQKDICEQSCSSKQTINSSVRRLEQAGYLTLKPGKGRDMHMFLTEAGKQLASEKIAPVIERENAAFFALSDAEQIELLQLSEKYFFNLQEQLQQLL